MATSVDEENKLSVEPQPTPSEAPSKEPSPDRQESEGAECRVCYGGREEGVLFKPCLCDGSMKYIHVHCLEKWRDSGRSRAKTECPNCHYKYKFARAQSVAWMSNKAFIHVITAGICILQWFLIFLFSSSVITPFVTQGVMASFWYRDDTTQNPENPEETVDNPVVATPDPFSVDDPQVALLDSIVVATILFGLSGWIIYAYSGRDNLQCRWQPHFIRIYPSGNILCAVIIMSVVAMGIFMSFSSIYDFVKRYVVRGRDRIQEYVLDVRESEAAEGVPDRLHVV
mmetsp:Transcript_8461/g.16406  ORF Transcript_8461/g.16406 Transcript_8461/m.16406 type:complete len:284 (-) Transcript_8461:140-991(-)